MGLEIEVIKAQLENLIIRRDDASHTFYQCVGAISVLSEQLNLLSLEEVPEVMGEE